MVRAYRRIIGLAGLATAFAVFATAVWAGTETLYTWGRNNLGQLGQGGTPVAPSGTTYVNKPIPVLGVGGSGTLSGVISCSGSDHMLALLNTGEVVSWGSNQISPSSTTVTYQLGNGTATAFDGTPKYVLAAAGTHLTGVVSVAAGVNHSLALLQGGTVVAWGNNADGQLGNNTQVQSQYPVTVLKAAGTPLPNIVAIAAGANFSVALDKNGNVWTWGLNNNGQTGTGDAATKLMAVQPHAAAYTQGTDPGGTLSGVSQISATDDHAMAVTTAGNAVAWGRNHNYGELGTNGNNGQAQKFPAWVVSATDPAANSKGGSTQLANITSVNIGKEHAIALLGTGEVCTWGANESGQLCIGVKSTNTSRSKPGFALASSGVNLTGVTDIYSGLLWSIVQKSDRTVWAWGNDKTGITGSDTYVGTLGQGTDLAAGQALYPVQVVGAGGTGTQLTYISALGGGANTNWALMGVLEPLGQIAGYDGRSRIISQAVGVATNDVYIVTLNYYGKRLDGYITLTHPTDTPYLARTCRGGDGNIYMLFVNEPNTLTKACIVKIPETATSANQAVASAVEPIANARGLAYYDATTLYIFQHSATATGALATIKVTIPVSAGSSLSPAATTNLARPAAGDTPVRMAVDSTAGDPYKMRVLYRDASGFIKVAQHATPDTTSPTNTITKTAYGAPIDLYISQATLGAAYSSVVLSSTGSAASTYLYVTAIQTDGTVANTCTDAARQACGLGPNQPSPVSLTVSPSSTQYAGDQSRPKVLMRTNIGDYYYYASLNQTWPYRPGSARVWTLSSDLANITYSSRAFRDLN